MLDKIMSARPSLSRAEKKVADQVLDDPDLCVEVSIQRLAQLAGVSDPTVLRFCRAIGCKGYHDFKIRMAQSIASQDKFFFRDVSAEDNTRQLSAKLVDSAIASMQNIQNQLNHEAMETAIDLYCKAERVEFYGSGGSALVAEDAQLKFFRLGKPAIAYADPHVQKASAVLLDTHALAIAISYSGRNRDVIEAMTLAKRAGSPVVTVTRTGSPLERLADINLNVEVSEDSDVFSPLKSRLAQMVVLDILAVGVALRGGEEMINRLARATLAIADNFVD
jgi:RpiR family carbohydrate utilization transcriptional regulator